MTERIWNEQHPVRKVLQDRRASGSMPGGRDDQYKVGLVVEGGGLRGVVSAAMLVALEDLGFAEAFDEVYSCSSGALNGAYFVARNTWFPLSIYFDDLTTGQFLDFSRVLRGQMPMNLDYVFDEVLGRRKPLDYDSIISAPQRLHVMITDVDAQKPVDITQFESPDDLKAAIRASAWLPVVTRGTSPFRGMRALDGAVLQRHPFRTARADGCTHILSLSTRPIARPTERLTIGNRMASRYLDRLQPGLGHRFLEAIQQYLTEDKPYLRKSRLHPGDAPAVLDVAPLPGTPEVKRHETRFGTLLQGARSAYRALYLALEDTDVHVVPRLMVYPPRQESAAR
jgi:predicted patatin/cPLA2 family phospholipase